MLHEYLNQGEISDRCSLFGLKYNRFNFCSLYNEKCLFSETVSLKNHGQVCLDKKAYQGAILVSFTAIPSAITTAIHAGEKYLLYHQIYRRFLPQSYGRHLVFCTR